MSEPNQNLRAQCPGPGLLVFNLDTLQLVSANQRAYRIFETSKDELFASPDAMFSLLSIDPTDLAGPARFERTLERRDGKRIQIEISLEILDLAEGRQALAILHERCEQETTPRGADPLGLALHSAVDMLALIDPKTLKFVRVNQGAVKALGYSKKEFLALHPTDIKPKLSLEEYQRCYVGPLLRNEHRSVKFETIHRRKDGTEYPAEVLIQRIDQGDGCVLLLNIVRDVSHRHGHYLERERFFSLSLEMLCIADTSGYFLRVNPSFSRVLGYSQDYFITRPIISFVHPDDVSITLQTVGRLAAGERVVGFENRYRRSDGDFRKLRWTAMIDSTTDRIYAAAHDVTEERERERELAETNRRLEEAGSLERAARKSLLTFSQNKSVHEALIEVHSILAEELNLRPLAFYTLDEWSGTLKLVAGLPLAPDRPQTYQCGVGLIGEVASTQVPVLIDTEAESVLGSPTPETGSNQVFPRTIFAIPLIHQERTLAVLAGASQRAVHSREWLALQQLASQTAVGLHALRQFQQLRRLSEQLNKRGRRINHQNQELKRANRLKSEFLANMSHELRTPLNAVIGFSECLKDGLVGELNEKQVDYATEIFSSGQHLLSLINDILDLSKVEAGMMELWLEEADVMSIVTNSISIIREQAAKKSLQVEHALDPKLKNAVLDARKFKQIIYNLLSNAVKFTEPEGTISVKTRLESGKLVLSVGDTGIGIAEKDQKILFEPFVQLEGNLGRKHQGTGFGLGLVKAFVELHGGSIELSSEVGVGSLFTVRMPCRTSETEWTPRESSELRVSGISPSPQLGSPKILVVDDDPAMRKYLVSSLTPCGYDIVTAADSAEALEALEQQVPDLIFLDILLEAESGWEFLADLKNNPLYKSIPVLLLSSSFFERDEGPSRGAVDLLQKPVTPTQLAQAISRAGLPAGRSAPPRVLVVDDDPRAVDYVARVLEADGCSVHRAYGGRDALDVLESTEVDLVVLDLMMPEVAGFEVLGELRDDTSKNSDVPVIVLTAKTLTTKERGILDESVSAILEKSQSSRHDVIQAVGLALRRGFKMRPHDHESPETGEVSSFSNHLFKQPKPRKSP